MDGHCLAIPTVDLSTDTRWYSPSNIFTEKDRQEKTLKLLEETLQDFVGIVGITFASRNFNTYN